MGVISGLQAAVKVASTVESTTAGWQVRDLSRAARYRASNTEGAETSAAGNRDWSGWYRNYGYTPLLFPGDEFTFYGSIDGENGCSGSAIAQRFTLQIPAEAGGNVGYRVDFASQGALSYGPAVAVDTSAVNAVNAAGRKANWADVDVGETSYMQLTLGAYNRPFAGSSVPGIVRRAAGAIHGQFLFQAYTNDPTLIPAVGSTGVLRFYVTASAYWELKWCRVEIMDDFGADHEGQRPVGYSVGGSFACRLGSEMGHVLDPAGETRWP